MGSGRSGKWVFGAAGALLLMLGAAGCTDQDNGTKEEVTEPAGETEPGKGNETAVQKTETPSYLKVTDQKKSQTELTKEALFEQEFGSEGHVVKLFVLPADEAERTELTEEQATYEGNAGDEIVKGPLAFYLGEQGADEAFLQSTEDREFLVNLNRAPFTVHQLGETGVLQLTEPVSSNGRDLSFWVVKDGALQAVKAGGEPAVAAATGKAKIVQERYVQTYEYYNAEPVGWVFRTYEWLPETAELKLYDESELFIEGPFHYEGAAEDIRGFYQETVDSWNELDDYVYPFPHLHFPANLSEQLALGFLVDGEAKVGGSVSAYLGGHPDLLGEYDAEGAWYYAFPDGLSIYHGGDDEIIGVGLSGANYLESVDELRALLGEPAEEHGSPVDDEPGLEGSNYDVGSRLIYDFGDYTAEVTYRDETIGSIYVRKKME
ncbi:hypothetical protein [Sporosarcina sp. NCCP-2716]|uniref:hypothetical protein n=1 Tax=Sporosarcina sp. NCCP-2716 TaxID=2943679 RepID=UPI00203A6A47|nr:hypothetical protein [Sporosarcina sp. NCCP-2716]